VAISVSPQGYSAATVVTHRQSDRRRIVDTVLGEGWASPVFADCVVGVLAGN